jgi:RNA polymerase sigma-70 factor, ECF subfamily
MGVRGAHVTIAVLGSASNAAQELEQIFKNHYQFVYRTAFSVTGSEADAEDILQTIFATLLRREIQPALRENPKAYLYRAAFNQSLNLIRSRKRHPTSGVQVLETVAAAPASSAEEELEKRLYEGIQQLHEGAAQLVILRYVHNYSIAEIAKSLGTTQSTVAVSLFRSRARLKKLILAAQAFGEQS